MKVEPYLSTKIQKESYGLRFDRQLVKDIFPFLEGTQILKRIIY